METKEKYRTPEVSIMKLHTIDEALDDIRNGKVVIVVDDEDRENEGDFVAAAELITPEIINFMTHHGRGLICTPLPEKRCDELGLELMVNHSSDPKETAFTVSVDLIGNGVTTGISAVDRAKTIRALMDSATKPWDLAKPGHVFPLRAKEEGVLRRPGHTEAAVDLARLAGLKEGGVIVEIMNEDGTMARLPELFQIADKFQLKIISIKDLIDYRLKKDKLIETKEEFPIKTHYGDFVFHCFKQKNNQQIHYAFTKGEWTEEEAVPVRVVSSNIYFDLLKNMVQGETQQLQSVFDIIHREGRGAVVFINNIKDGEYIAKKIEQMKRFLRGETHQFTPQMDEKDLGIGVQIIKNLGIKKVKLITKNPSRKINISEYGIEIVDYIPLKIKP